MTDLPKAGSVWYRGLLMRRVWAVRVDGVEIIEWAENYRTKRFEPTEDWLAWQQGATCVDDGGGE